ncbi:MAG: hypothetical protein BAJALOKI2v1_280038 [Promethearchaeota archaeon]|nr:MAG: hypothetical protein BAJALOKI2v1_280038 [Candidatus Lokiarchaeota archaeon]
MSFHNPGVAAVKDEDGAYHINFKGKNIYDKKFYRAFGYYEGIAAVQDDSGWYHIDLNARSLYNSRFDWVGNFQENRCSVRDYNGKYFHIKVNGQPAYDNLFNYVGDFKYGIAVVYEKSGLAKHIDKNGNEINLKKFEELGIFHKGYAIAKDEKGYFHIDKSGEPLYIERYKWVEPFYNEQAFCCKKNGEKVIIDEKGLIIEKIITENSKVIKDTLRTQLMNKLVGYWDTQLIYSIVKLEILDLIKKGINSLSKLKKKINIPKDSLKMIIDILLVWNFIKRENHTLKLSYSGNLLTENHPKTLKYAALMWGSEHYLVMSRLYQALKKYKPQFEKIYGDRIFQYFNKNKERGKIIFKALSEYADDYEKLLSEYHFPNSKVILDIGAGSGVLLQKILKKYKHIQKGIIFDLPYAIELARENLENYPLIDKISFHQGNFFETIPFKVDTIILSRILHDLDNSRTIKLLKNLRNSLSEGGILILFETIVPNKLIEDIGTTLNFNLLVSTGGRERTLNEFQELLIEAGFKIIKVKSEKTIISLIIATIEEII